MQHISGDQPPTNEQVSVGSPFRFFTLSLFIPFPFISYSDDL
jgi:hypothetical protein